MKKIIEVYYPVILAFVCLLYSVGLGLSGNTAEAQYTAHWPGTILLFATSITVTGTEVPLSLKTRVIPSFVPITPSILI